VGELRGGAPRFRANDADGEPPGGSENEDEPRRPPAAAGASLDTLVIGAARGVQEDLFSPIEHAKGPKEAARRL
jgi:hypothetical protein